MRARGTLAFVAVALTIAIAGDASAQPAPTPPRRGKPVKKPAPARDGRGCEDPLTGTWRTKVWRPESSAWDRVTLQINRHGVQLSGWIIVETWYGDSDQPEPPTCEDGSPDRERWRERLSGSFKDGVVDILGTRVTQLNDGCERGGDASGYRLDHFRGQRATDAELLITTNDDGGVDHERPHHFQRVSCRP